MFVSGVEKKNCYDIMRLHLSKVALLLLSNELLIKLRKIKKL